VGYELTHNKREKPAQKHLAKTPFSPWC